MKFPKAHAGVKKLFAVEIIEILIAFVALLGVVFLATKFDALVLAGAGMVLAAGIAGVVAFILSLVGLHQAGKDEIQIRFAFCMVVLGIVLGAVSTILGCIKNPSSAVKVFADISDTGESLTKLFSGFYVLMGISALASKLNDKAMEKKGKKLANWVILLYCCSIVLSIVGMILGALPSAPEAVSVITGIVAIVAAVAELVIYILTVIYYAKAVKMLSK